MELALFVYKNEKMAKYWDAGIPAGFLPENVAKNSGEAFDRLYFGQEFCERLIPSEKDLKEALDFAGLKKAGFTFLTPFVTEQGLEMWGRLLEKLYSLKPDCEVVVNDVGILHLIREKFSGFVPVLGRLLTKQKRGPQILRMEGKVPDSTIEHFRRFNADVPVLAGFYHQLGINRIELDNTLQGISRDNTTAASLYFPYAYVSTTRMCLTNQSDNRTRSMRAIFPCKHECADIHFEIEHGEIPIPVTIAGNTQFIVNRRLPESPDSLYIDRLVYEPEIPV
ncbi:MAG: hypothetical protein LWY06_07415 [Firmicutes bacterium]|nr:hypothetical protein [Bacillota bacterium]